MHARRLAAALAGVALAHAAAACTTLAVARRATRDGSTYTSSTADCIECDFRLARVPARAHAAGAVRAVYLVRFVYPHVVQAGRAETWEAGNVEGVRAQMDVWLPGTEVMGFIPEVAHTFALFETGSGYALVNEYMVTLAESTCPTVFVGTPIAHGGKALFDVGELGRVALERSKSAREAIKTMGQLGEKYGYYGAEWDRDSKFDEAGENLMVSDRDEAWVFHIIPDDTGASAIWVAQRVPDTDITVVANNFIIRAIDTNDSDNFLFSDNLHSIAKKHDFWDPARDGEKLDFASVYGRASSPRHSSYTTMRIWRVFTIANPDLVATLDPHPNALMDGYPFSVTPKVKLSAQDLFRINRDHYEGTQFDLTKGAAGGPYGDPDRYDTAAVGNMTRERAFEGEFGRPISMFRTSYTSIARANGNLPREVGALLYFSQQQPSSSVFLPLYLAMQKIPTPLMRGSLFKYSKESMFWAVTSVSNWAHRYYLHTVDDIRAVQASVESYDVAAMDRKAAKLIKKGRMDEAMEALGKFSTNVTLSAHETYLDLLPTLMARYHDGLRLEDATAPDIKMKSFFYPQWWLESVGYFSAAETGGSAGVQYESDGKHATVTAGKGGPLSGSLGWAVVIFTLGAALGASLCMVALYLGTDTFKSAASAGYRPIPDA